MTGGQLTAQDLSISPPTTTKSLNSSIINRDSESQDPQKEDNAYASHRYWVEGNIISIMQTPGISLSGNYAHTQNYVITAQASAIEGPYVHGGSQFLHSYREASLLFGLITEYNLFQGSISVGPTLTSYATSESAYPYSEPENVTQIGFSSVVRSSINISFFGVGIKGFTNIGKQTFWGVGFYIKVCKLK